MQYVNAVWNRRIGAGLGVLSSFAAVGVLLVPLLRLIGVGADENNAVAWVVALLIAAVVVALSMARCTRLAVSRSRGRVIVTNPIRTHVVDFDDVVEVDGAFVLFAGTCVRVTVRPPGAAAAAGDDVRVTGEGAAGDSAAEPGTGAASRVCAHRGPMT